MDWIVLLVILAGAVLLYLTIMLVHYDRQSKEIDRRNKAGVAPAGSDPMIGLGTYDSSSATSFPIHDSGSHHHGGFDGGGGHSAGGGAGGGFDGGGGGDGGGGHH